MSKNFFNTWKVATEKDCSAEWSCGKPGEYFRCALCGHKFAPGDEFLVLYTNDLPKAGGNPIVCVKEKGSLEEMRTAWDTRCKEWLTDRFWWFRKHQ